MSLYTDNRVPHGSSAYPDLVIRTTAVTKPRLVSLIARVEKAGLLQKASHIRIPMAQDSPVEKSTSQGRQNQDERLNVG